MKLVKSLLLGTSAGLLAIAGANAADLPSRKAAPVTYVKVCDAYGAGFFYIPGTDTCLKVGGYVRAEYNYVPSANLYKGGFTAAAAENESGAQIRTGINMDARTQSAWGTVRTYLAFRERIRTGSALGVTGNTSGFASEPQLEAGFIQFAGFTFGQAGENFDFLPPITYTANHRWSSHAYGVSQIAYTALLGGGFSATIALEDENREGAMNAIGLANGVYGQTLAASYPTRLPVLVGNVRADQSWGSAQLMGAVGQVRGVTAATTITKTAYAIGAGVKFNLPMLAAGDQLWLTAAYADGMIDMIDGSTGTGTPGGATADYTRGLYRYDYAMWTNAAGQTGLTKGWSVGAMMVHYWTPSLRSVFAASYLNLKLPSFVTVATESDLKATELSGSLIWSPVKNFDIGMELAYEHLSQSDVTGIAAAQNVKASPSQLAATLRVQRSF
jgi:hypothetical protein